MRRRWWVLVPFGLAFALAAIAGCFKLVGPPTTGNERDEIACADGRDNDLDGRRDCQDEDCLMAGHCGEYIPNTEVRGPENTFDRCSDGIDNDGDGQFDCGDRDCQGIMELCCQAEVDNATCSNGVDDDGNGFADCQDFSCRNNDYVTVCDGELDCTDGLDNDGDGPRDCGDPDCADHPDCRPIPEADCGNGIDDDGDGSIDCFDPGCYTDPRCLGPEDNEEFCRDGNSNDGDPYVDCDDFDCAGTDACSMRPDPTSENEGGEGQECDNGIDDDGDGFIDCADFSCTRADRGALPSAIEWCAERTETTYARCTDGRDNDGNGFRDCDDFSCRFVQVAHGSDVCETNEECAPGESCTNFACQRPCELGCLPGTQCDPASQVCIQSCVSDSDCDPGEICHQAKCLAVRSPCHEVPVLDGRTTIRGDADVVRNANRDVHVRLAIAACTDGIDNEGDDFTDCEDWECNHHPRLRDDEGERLLCRSPTGRALVCP